MLVEEREQRIVRDVAGDHHEETPR